MGLNIREVAERRGGVNRQTIRYYEREQLLPKPPRLSSGYRFYPGDTVRRVRFIKRAQGIGFTLQRMKEALRRITERCFGCSPANECPILESIDSDEILQ